jgi:hypothetical protein
MAGVGVAPAQVGVRGPGLNRVVGVVRVGDGELPQRSEVGLDRVRPRGVGRRETQLDLVLLRPASDVGALVGGQVAVVNVRQPVGTPLSGPARARGGPDPERAEFVERKDPVQEAAKDLLDAVELGVALGVRGLLPVLVRWKVMPGRASRHRNASRPMRITRPCTLRR